MKTIKVGSQVAFNSLKDKVWFEVLQIKGFTLVIREAGTDFSTQTIDKSYVKEVK